MLNLIKADMFRTLKSRRIFIIIFIMILCIAFTVITNQVFFLTSPTPEQEQLLDGLLDIYRNSTKTGLVLVKMMTKTTVFLPFLMIMIIALLLNNDIGKRAYLNILTKNTSRTTYFLSKVLAINLITTIFYLGYYLLSFVIGTMLNGNGITSLAEILSVIQVIWLQILLQIAWNTLICSFIIATRQHTAGLVAYLGIPALLSGLVSNMPSVSYLSIFAMLDNVSFLALTPMQHQAIPISLFVIVSAIIVGNIIFVKRDLT